MKVAQIASIINDVYKEVIGTENITTEDLQNIVDIGKTLTSDENVDKYVKALQNRIGKTIFVDRPYEGRAPSLLMDGWEYGSILQKIRAEVPESEDNPTWELEDGKSYDPHVFKSPKVRQKFFNQKDTYQIHMSFAREQIKQSFANVGQLNAFFSMIEGKIRLRKTMDTDNLVMRTVNTFIGATLYSEYNDGSYATKSGVRAVNLLYKYNQMKGGTPLTADKCLYDLDFLKFAAFQMGLYSDRLAVASTLFNIGGTVKYTPHEMQRAIMLSEFAKAADVYLQSDTFHNEFVKFPKTERVTYWQGSGTDYSFESTSKIDAVIQNPTGSGNVPVQLSGVLAVILDRDAAAVCNVRDYVTSLWNPLAEFTNQWYKYDAQYMNDYDENGVVFFVA